jgi:hypothetical protein
VAGFDAVALTERRHKEWEVEVFRPSIPVVVSGMRVLLDPWHVAIAMGVIHARDTALPSGALAKGWTELIRGRERRLSGWMGRIGSWINRRVVGRKKEVAEFVDVEDWAETARHIPTIQRPPWLSPEEARAWLAAKKRAAVYVTGITDKARQRVQDLVTVAVERGWDKDQLTESLERGWVSSSRDWQRVAITELQGAYNEGTVVHGIDLYGQAARVARVPEDGACEKCRELFLGADGRPIIWRVGDLVANGSNVGRKRDKWKATVWPIHPRGRCGTVLVPPGQEFDDAWKLVQA